MSLTGFDSNSSNLSHPSYSPPRFNIPQIPELSPNAINPEDSSQILISLGKKIQFNTKSLTASLSAIKEIDPSRIKNFEHLTQELQSIFSKTSQLMQKNYNDDSSFIQQEIEELEDEVNSLESKLAKSLSEKELAQMLEITKDFHDILKSAESYLAFKERFLAVYEQLSNSYELMFSPLASDLHGWSPSAARGATESLDHMRTLIKMTVPILEQKGAFTTEILEQLFVVLHAGSLACSDWLHGVAAKYSHVLSVAKEQWDQTEKAYEARPSVEGYVKMQLYGKQLQDMQKVFGELQKLPESSIFRWMADRLDQQMQKGKIDEEYNAKKNILNDLQLLQASLAEATRLVKSQSDGLDKVVKDSRVAEKLAKAEEAVAKTDLKPYIQNIREEYERGERSLDRYVAAKCRLGHLPKSYEQELDFCREEEQRLIQEEGCPIDFDVLVQAEMMKLGQPKSGILSRLWQAMPDPANWSDSTKRWVHNSLIGLQLGDQILKMIPKSNPVANVPVSPKLSKEDQDRLENEMTWIGNILGDHFESFKEDPRSLDNLAKKVPEVVKFLETLVVHYSDKPSRKEINIVRDNYKIYRTEILLNAAKENTQVPVKAQPINASPKLLAATSSKTTDTAMSKMETALSTTQNVENIQGAVREIAVLDRQLQQCNRMEFLKPSRPVTPKALLVLREELSLLKHGLAVSMENKPLDPSSEWSLAVQQQCHDLRDIEKRIGEAMSEYEEARAMNNYYNYNVLDVLGNKHKNLVKQYDIAIAIGIEGLEVPMPQGIESHKVMAFLKNYAPEIFEHWDQIRAISKAQEKSGILKNSEVVSHLKAIDEAIENAFLKAATDDKAFTNLGISQEMKDWLAELDKAGEHLMVRSTGAEDSKKSANAGGNASISYVKPTQEELSTALGEVVRSYFSTGSLQKRLNANLDPFEEELRVAVTTQALIGEPVGGATDPGEIPVSLVLFTSEPLYVGDEEFRTMRISATYGHGEGVVGNQGIASDTALVLISATDPGNLYILYDNQEKPERLVPVRDEATGKITLQQLANSKEMANKRALNNDMIIRLYEWGVIGEKYFDGDPTDMEIVIKGDTIYPVQGRPINRPKLFATYLDMKKVVQADASPIEKTMKLDVVVPGTASVVAINWSNEILIANTLKEAEDIFVPGQHKLIVVGKPEPANSHPVVNFSDKGMPCLYANKANFAYIQEIAKGINPAKQLAVCVQSGEISAWDSSKGKISDFTSEGFVVHPAKIAISIPVKDPLAKREGIFAAYPQEVKDLLGQLSSATNDAEAMMHLKALQDHPWITSLNGKIAGLEEKIGQNALFEKHARPMIEVATKLKNKIEEANAEIEALLSQPGPSQRLELLIRIKALDTLLFQPLTPGSVGQHSLLGIQESFAAVDALMLYQAQLPYPSHFADLLMDGSQAPVGEAFEDWNRFLLQLEPYAEKTMKAEASPLSLDDIFKFRTSLHTLRKAEVLSLFMTFFFKPKEDPVDTLRAIIALMPLSEEPLIEEIFARKAEMRQLRKDIARFGNPKDYPEMLERLKIAVDAMMPMNMPWFNHDQWKAVSPVTRSIAIQAMNELVDLYDSAIKSMKASHEITNYFEKTGKFKEMLGPYMKLFQSWSKNIVTASGYATHKDSPLDRYLREFEEKFAGMSDKNMKQLDRSSEFSVSAAVLNSGAMFSDHWPKTFEDVFTLIHQNLMASTSVLMKGLFSSDQMQTSRLPPILKSGLEKIQLIRGDDIGTPQQIGIVVDKRGISINFNIPLRDHSGKFSLRYDRESGKTLMEAQFLGGNEESRWDIGVARARILNAANVLPLNSEPEMGENELLIEWDISQNESLERAFIEFSQLAVLSFKANNDFEPELVRKLVTQGNVADTIRFLLEDSRWSFVQFHRYQRIRDEFVEQVLLSMDKTIIESEGFTRLALKTPRIIKFLMQALFLSKDGSSPEQLQASFPEQYFPFIQHSLEFFKEESSLINVLTNVDLNHIDSAFHPYLGLWEKLFAADKGFSEASFILKKIVDNSESAKFKDLFKNLLERLVMHDKGRQEVMSRIQEGMKSENALIQEHTLFLLSSFVESGKGHDMMPEIILENQKGMKSAIASVQKAALNSYIEIVEFGQGQGHSEARSAAEEGMRSDQVQIQRVATELLLKVELGHDQGIQEIKSIAYKALRREDYSASVLEMLLTRFLVLKKGQGVHEIIPILEMGMQSGDKEILGVMLTVYMAVIREGEGQGIREAINAGQKGMQIENWVIQPRSLRLFSRIVELAKGQGISEANSAAQQGFKSSILNVQKASLDLMSKLAEFGDSKIRSEVISTIENGMENESLQTDLLLVMSKVIEFGHGQGKSEAIFLVQKGIKSQIWSIQRDSVKFISKVISFCDSEEMTKIIALAEEGLKSDMPILQEETLNLLLNILQLKNGENIQEICSLALGSTKDPYWRTQQRAERVLLTAIELGIGEGVSEGIAYVKERMNNNQWSDAQSFWIQFIKLPQTQLAIQHLFIQLEVERDFETLRKLKSW